MAKDKDKLNKTFGSWEKLIEGVPQGSVLGPLLFKKIFAKWKFSPALLEKIPSFVCLVFKIENKWILKLQNLFS